MNIKTYLKKYFPDDYARILEETRMSAREMFDRYPDIQKVTVPYCLPLDFKHPMPIMAYVVYDRDLNEVKP